MGFKTNTFGDILTIYLNDEPVNEWIRGNVGKAVMMPSLLHGCEVLLNGKSESKLCAIVISEVNFKSYNYHISVKRKSISDTLIKIMNYGLEQEDYEMCARVKKLQKSLDG